jgi:hypothetical protein
MCAGLQETQLRCREMCAFNDKCTQACWIIRKVGARRKSEHVLQDTHKARSCADLKTATTRNQEQQKQQPQQACGAHPAPSCGTRALYTQMAQVVAEDLNPSQNACRKCMRLQETVQACRKRVIHRSLP